MIYFHLQVDIAPLIVFFLDRIANFHSDQCKPTENNFGSVISNQNSSLMIFGPLWPPFNVMVIEL